MSKVDLHVKVLDKRVTERAKRRGLDALVFAPHFTRLPEIEAQCRQFQDEELQIFPAREIFTGPWWDRRHVLAIGLTDPVPDFLPLESTITELRRQDAIILAPHPLFLSVSLRPNDLRRYRSDIRAIEQYNPKFLPIHTYRVRRLLSDLDMPSFATSYAHLRKSVGEVWTEFSTEINSMADLESAIRDGEIDRIGRRRGFSHGWRRTLEFGHLGWENSWHKFRRVAIRGMEPTHPDHPAYEGRFDDESDY